MRRLYGSSFLFLVFMLVFSLPVAGTAPMVQPTAAGDEYWDDRFGCRLSGDITDLTVFQDRLYAVGVAQCGAQTTPQRTLLAFNGQVWEPLQSLQTDPLNVVLGTSTYLYAAGNINDGRIVRYDGTTFDSLPSIDTPAITSMYVQAMAERDDSVYIVSTYQTADSGTLAGVFQWNGTNWTHLGDLAEWDANVQVSIEANANGVYVGGSFSGIGATTVENLAHWNGTTWSATAILTDPVHDLVLTDNSIYTLVSTNTLQVAIQASEGTASQNLGIVHSEDVRLSVIDGVLYIHGELGELGGVQVGNIARWDRETQTWIGVGQGLFTPSYVEVTPGASAFPEQPQRACRACDLVEFDHRLVIGGATALLDTPSIYAHSSVWMLYRNEWVALPKEAVNLQTLQNPTHLALRASEDGVYYGGFFKGVGSSNALNHAWWDGQEWHDWSTGYPVRDPSELFSSNRVVDGVVYLTTRSTNQNYSRLLQRTVDGQWQELAFMNSSSAINALDILNQEIYVGGSFNEIEGVPAQNLARWDGVTWHAVTAGYPSGIIRNVITSDTGVYILRENGGTRDLWRLENETWEQMTTSMTYFSNGLAWWNGAMYHYGGSLVKLVNGSWQLIPGAPSAIISLAGGTDSLYIIGDFSFANGMSVSRIVRWDGTNWLALGSGLPARPHRIAAWGRNMYVGGEFTRAGLTDSLHLAAWHNPVGANSVPRTVSNTFLLEWGESIEIDLTEYAWDLDYDPLTFSDLSLTNGSYTDLGDGRIRVTAPINTNEPFTLTYTVSDDQSGSSIGQLFFNLVPQYQLYLPQIRYVVYQP